MKTKSPFFVVALALFSLPTIATAELSSTLIAPSSSGAADASISMPMPRLSPAASNAIPGSLVDQALRERTLPRMFAAAGRTPAMQRVVEDSIKRAHAAGHLAEEDFVARNPAYRKTLSPNAPENDVWTYFKGEFYGAQIKTHTSGDPAAYMRDMFKDSKSEFFLIPDDHYVALEAKIRQQVIRAQAGGNDRVVGAWQHQLRRLHRLGRDYRDIDQAILSRAASVVRQSKALRAGAAGAVFTFVIDGAVVVYRSADGQLTPAQTVEAVSEAGTRAAIIGTATGTAVLLGANPVGFTVLVVAGITYIVVDYAIQEARPSYHTSPMTRGQIEAITPEGWQLAKF